MKTKIFLTSIFAITFALPAVAEITSGATCDTTNLGQSENNSTANVEAIWTAKKYSVRYRSDENDSFYQGCGTSGTQRANKCGIATYDESFTFNSDSGGRAGYNPGYTFSGWSCVDTNNNITTYTAGQTVNSWAIDSGLDCTGQWTANTINIDWYNDGTRIAQNTCTYDSTITLPETPTKTGYTFNGWVLFDICPTFNTAQTCRENSACMWSDEINECVNYDACSRDLSEAECNAKSYCNAVYRDIDMEGNTVYWACTMSSEFRCASQPDAESCTGPNGRACEWNTEQNKCVVKSLGDLSQA